MYHIQNKCRVYLSYTSWIGSKTKILVINVLVEKYHLNTFINTSQQTQNICITFVQRCTNVIQMLCVYWDMPAQQTQHVHNVWTNVEAVGPTLHKCYTNVLCLLGTCCVEPLKSFNCPFICCCQDELHYTLTIPFRDDDGYRGFFFAVRLFFFLVKWSSLTQYWYIIPL